MKTISCPVLLTIMFVFIVGCSGNTDPITASEERTGQVFLNAIPIFDATTNEEFPPFFHDIALAQLCVAGQFDAGQEFENNHGCIAVTLNREDNNPANPFKPVFRWLDSENYFNPESPIFYVCERDLDDEETADYRAPACDGIFNPWNSGLVNIESSSIEVVVAYVVRNRSDVEDDEDWDIEVTALQWTGGDLVDYWEKEPTWRITYVIPDVVADGAESNPDIAYYHETGDVYIAYTDQSDADGNVQLLKYREYIRSLDAISNEFLAQLDDGHNGYDPSIDIGDITYLGQTQTWIAIAYTAQFHEFHNGYHVNVTAWRPEIAELGPHGGLSVRNPDNFWRDAGLPSVDIAPNDNARHVAALTYTQVTGADGFGPTTATFVVRFLGDIADLDEHILITDPGPLPLFADALYSSIAINRQDEANDDITASLAFMAQDNIFNNSDNWRPRVANMLIHDSMVPPQDLEVTWSDWADAGNNFIIIGNYNISDIPFQNPGVASAIVTTNNDRYWASWNDRFEMEPPPTQVWASWGFAGI